MSSSRADSFDASFHPSSFYADQHLSFYDIDEPSGLQTGLSALANCAAHNLVVDFSDRHAWACHDLSVDEVMSLVKGGGWPDEKSTRWIDISCPTRQRGLLEALAWHYDFSPRLLAVMCSEPPGSSDRVWSSSAASRASSGNVSVPPLQRDVEKMMESIGHGSLSSSNPARTGNLYELLEHVWHYTSVDQGANYTCIGYNTIYTIRGLNLPADQLPSQVRGPLVGCIGAWTWLILCNDRTVISINEDLFPSHHNRLSAQQRSIMLRTKQNALQVFRSLSSVLDPTAHGLPRLPIRKRLSDDGTTEAARCSAAPGLLFYFLFENWFNSYSLVTRKDSRYGQELQHIRSDMFKRPDLTQIQRLDSVGNDLLVLKRHYQSYNRLIDRVVEMACDSAAGHMTNSNNASGHLHVGIDPGPAARVRFERLKDMITLYALSEIKDYLDKKAMLVDMNFSLIAIKESEDVERLTRVGLFITKATILFLPIELMTAYFGTNLDNLQYSVTQYWIAFASVLVASWVVLMGFGVVSGTMENWSFVTPVMSRLRRRK